MMEYKVDDKVALRRDLKVGHNYGDGAVVYTEHMSLYASETQAITDLIMSEGIYMTEEGWMITDDMIDHSASKKAPREVVTIPKCVANWIEHCKRSGEYGLLGSMVFSPAEVRKWVRSKGTAMDNKMQEKYARAWLDGYEIEDKKYTVSVAGSTLASLLGSSIKPFQNSDIGRDDFRFRVELTEEEIKDYDPRYWPFAIEVNEEEF